MWMPAHLLLRLAWLLAAGLALAACSWGTTNSEVDAGNTGHGFGPPGEHGERRITFLDKSHCGRDAEGSLVVYGGQRGLYLIDLERETETRLDSPFLRRFVSVCYPAMSGRRVAFQAYESDEAEDPGGIAVLNLDTLDGIFLRGTKERSQSDVFQALVVWKDNRFLNPTDPNPDNRMNSEVYLYDLRTGQELRITSAPNHQVEPKIYGDYVVWQDERDRAQRDIWAYQLSTGRQWNLSDHPADQWLPDIRADQVVWADLRNGTGEAGWIYYNSDIYLHDLRTGELRRITDDPADQEFPRIFGRYITWNDLRNGSRSVGGGSPSGADVYLYDLQTGEEKRVTWDEYNDGGGIIAGDKIVWFNGGNLYMKPLDAL